MSAKKWFRILEDTDSNLKVVDNDFDNNFRVEVLTIPCNPECSDASDGADITLEDILVDDTQKWEKVLYNGGPYFYLRNPSTDKYLITLLRDDGSSDMDTKIAGKKY